MLPENLLWAYIVQLSSVIRTIHSAGLSVRCLHPSKILLISRTRPAIRLNCCGIFDLITFDPTSNPAQVTSFQQVAEYNSKVPGWKLLIKNFLKITARRPTLLWQVASHPGLQLHVGHSTGKSQHIHGTHFPYLYNRSSAPYRLPYITSKWRKSLRQRDNADGRSKILWTIRLCQCESRGSRKLLDARIRKWETVPAHCET